MFDTSDSDSDGGFPVIPPKDKDQRILLPLERYAKKQKQTAKDIQRTLQVKKQELAKCPEKLNMASQQNMGNKARCGNCHLKLGHTKKVVILVLVDLLTPGVTFQNMAAKN